MTYTRFAAAVVLVGLFPAMAGAQNREHQQIFADLRMIQEQVQRLQQAVNALAEQAQATDKRLDDQARQVTKGFADQGVLIDALSGNVNTVRENLSTNTVTVNRLTQELQAIRQGLGMQSTMLNDILRLLTPPQAMAEPGAAGAVTTPPGIPPTAPPVQTVPPPVTGGGVAMPPSPQEYFNTAWGYYSNGQYELAIEGFDDYLAKFPDSPDAPRAQSFIGDAYYQLGRFNEAVAAQGKVIANYKNSEQVPSAYYSQGLAYQALGKKQEAINNYQLIRKQFPGSEAEVLAVQSLKQLGVIKD
jgi:tol-pal system protein YbgF